MSSQPCGCDPTAKPKPYVCMQHTIDQIFHHIVESDPLPAIEPRNATGPAVSVYTPDTPLAVAKRRAFDYPSQANLDALIEAVRAECRENP